MKTPRSKEARCVHFVMTGLLAIIAILWFFVLAYMYLSWVILPTFFIVDEERRRRRET